MKKLRFAWLAVENNDYQEQQVASARAAAAKHSVDLQVVHTEHDSIIQSQRVLELLQSPAGERPDAIFFEPVGTALAQPARAAAAAGIGWVVLNRENVDYMPDLRERYPTPMFCVTTSHDEVGRIQGEQLARLLPQGGALLYVEGPADNDAALRRTAGMMKTKPASLEVRTLRGRWTEASGYNAVSSWLKLTIAKEFPVGAVAAQNDAMAMGALKALQELPAGPIRDRWLSVPFLGCDGLPTGGQAAVRNGLLAATVVIPANAGQAVELMASALTSGQQPAEAIFTKPTSFPDLTSLSSAGQHRSNSSP